MIEALYRASQAGVPVDLVVRGVCCLRPGMPGISENIRVTEHRRSVPGAQPAVRLQSRRRGQIFLSSADWMPRNFYRRVEVMFPIEAPELKRRILEEVIPAYLQRQQAELVAPHGVTCEGS